MGCESINQALQVDVPLLGHLSIRGRRFVAGAISHRRRRRRARTRRGQFGRSFAGRRKSAGRVTQAARVGPLGTKAAQGQKVASDVGRRAMEEKRLQVEVEVEVEKVGKGEKAKMELAADLSSVGPNCYLFSALVHFRRPL